MKGIQTCKIPRSTQRGCSGIRRSPKMCQANLWKMDLIPATMNGFKGLIVSRGFPLKQIFSSHSSYRITDFFKCNPPKKHFFLWFGRLNPFFIIISDPKVSPEKTRKPKKQIRSICFFVSSFVYDFSGSDLYTFLYLFLFQMGFLAMSTLERFLSQHHPLRVREFHPPNVFCQLKKTTK